MTSVLIDCVCSFFKENVRYPVRTCRVPISWILGTRFSDSRNSIIFSDSRDPIFNCRNRKWVHKTALKKPWYVFIKYLRQKLSKDKVLFKA